MTSPPPDPDRLSRFHRVCVEGFWESLRQAPGAERRSLGPPGRVDVLKCDMKFNVTNPAFVGDPGDSADRLLGQVAEAYDPSTPWRVVATGPGWEEVGRAAVARGLRPTPPEPGMVLDPIPEFPPPPAGLEVRTVSSPAELHDWGVVWCKAFRIPRSVFRVLYSSLPSGDGATEHPTRLQVGYAGSRPAACSAMCVAERAAGIFSVGTVPFARGRGYGTALTARAVEDGRQLGATSAFLLASPMGYPVYQRMGFRHFSDYPAWEVPMGFLQTLRAMASLPGLARRARAAR